MNSKGSISLRKNDILYTFLLVVIEVCGYKAEHGPILLSLKAARVKLIKWSRFKDQIFTYKRARHRIIKTEHHGPDNNTT